MLYIAAATLVLFLLVGTLPPVRVGDGSEYYGLYYAFAVEHRPWMGAAAYDAYGALVQSHQVPGLVPKEALINAFEKLRVGTTSDFNHFWFYSLLAFLSGKTAAVPGIDLSVHGSFLTLHAVALGGTAAVAYRYHRWQGVLAVALMLLASPVLWYIDKVHTEFLTVCLVLSGVILLRSRRYLAASLCFALAATQNPSFALIACIPLFNRVVLQREQHYSAVEAGLLVVVVLAVLAHPVYYFSRYGVVTPQLLAGGAAMGRNLSTFYASLLDPDLGLLPNWPLAYVALLTLALARAGSKRPGLPGRDRRWDAFALLYLVINLYVHSSTTNLNSGATPGLARYALWYLPLGFPLLMQALALFTYRTQRFSNVDLKSSIRTHNKTPSVIGNAK